MPYCSCSLPTRYSRSPAARVRSSSVSLPHFCLILPDSCCHLPCAVCSFILLHLVGGCAGSPLVTLSPLVSTFLTPSTPKATALAWFTAAWLGRSPLRATTPCNVSTFTSN